MSKLRKRKAKERGCRLEEYCEATCRWHEERKPARSSRKKLVFPDFIYLCRAWGRREDRYQNRYPGFLSERLMTFFFEKRRERYRVVYADKNFLGE